MLELVLNVEVVIGHFGLLSSVFIVEVIKLVHLKVEVLESNLQQPNFLLVRLHAVVQSQFLLLKNSLLRPQVIACSRDLLESCLLLNQLSLVSDPLLLNLCDFIFLLFNLLQNIVLFGFLGSRVFVLPILRELSPLSVKAIDFMLFLRDFHVLLLNLVFELLHVSLFLLELIN